MNSRWRPVQQRVLVRALLGYVAFEHLHAQVPSICNGRQSVCWLSPQRQVKLEAGLHASLAACKHHIELRLDGCRESMDVASALHSINSAQAASCLVVGEKDRPTAIWAFQADIVSLCNGKSDKKKRERSSLHPSSQHGSCDREKEVHCVHSPSLACEAGLPFMSMLSGEWSR